MDANVWSNRGWGETETGLGTEKLKNSINMCRFADDIL